MKQLIKLVNSPFASPLEVAGTLVIKLHVPYSERSITIQVNPSVEHYTAKDVSKNIEIRNFMVTETTDETKVASFDLENNRRQSVSVAGTDYEIELMNVGKEKVNGEEFLFYEFFISDNAASGAPS